MSAREECVPFEISPEENQCQYEGAMNPCSTSNVKQ